MAQLKLQLLKEEAKELSERGPLYKVSAGAFFRKALDIEERQYISAFSNLYPSLTKLPDAHLPQKRGQKLSPFAVAQ